MTSRGVITSTVTKDLEVEEIAISYIVQGRFPGVAGLHLIIQKIEK